MSLSDPEVLRRDRLEQVITQTRMTLTEHSDYLSGNETRTRELVINPVLTALGWDTTEPACVWLEYRKNGNKMDYVLLSPSGGIVAVVEAKPSDSGPKDTDRRQASGYATEIGARYAVLTYGGRWEAWEMVHGRHRQECMIFEVHLMTGEVTEIASELGKLHRDVLQAP